MDEHKALIKFCVEKVNGRIPVIAGAGSNDTLHAIGTTTFAESVGADAILSVVPYYNKPTQKGLYNHFSTIANSTKLPVLLYNVPGRTSTGLTPSTVYELSKIPNIIGIKECQFSNVAKIKQLCGDNFAIYSGEDGNIVPLLSLGGQGVISVMANIIPKTTHDMVASFLSGDIKRSLELQLEVLDLVDALFIESNPAPIKEAMNMLGMNVGICRLPIACLEDSSKARLYKELKALNMLT